MTTELKKVLDQLEQMHKDLDDINLLDMSDEELQKYKILL